MQFRQRGGRVQVLKSYYSPQHKRSYSRVVGSLDADRPELTEDLLSNLNDEEIQEVEHWIEKRRAEYEDWKSRIELELLPDKLSRARHALEQRMEPYGEARPRNAGEGDVISRDHARRIYEQIDKLESELRRIGYNKRELLRGGGDE